MRQVYTQLFLFFFIAHNVAVVNKVSFRNICFLFWRMRRILKVSDYLRLNSIERRGEFNIAQLIKWMLNVHDRLLFRLMNELLADNSG